MLPRTRVILIATAIVAFVIAGCDVTAFYGLHDDGFTSDPYLLSVIEPNGDRYRPGDEIAITWEGAEQPETLRIELLLSGAVIETLAVNHPSDLWFSWRIPTDFSVAHETPDEYRIVVRGFHPDQSVGTLELTAASEPFSILAPMGNELTDLTVSERSVTITLTDNGAQIDGDTVNLYLNGDLFISGHVLVGGAGTSFPMDLLPGPNTLEIYAVNEGSVTPNTALLQVTNVIEGPAAQEWRLSQGETGSLTVTAP